MRQLAKKVKKVKIAKNNDAVDGDMCITPDMRVWVWVDLWTWLNVYEDSWKLKKSNLNES